MREKQKGRETVKNGGYGQGEIKKKETPYFAKDHRRKSRAGGEFPENAEGKGRKKGCPRRVVRSEKNRRENLYKVRGTKGRDAASALAFENCKSENTG